MAIARLGVGTLIVFLSLVWLAAPAFATGSRNWTGAVNGNWSEPGNWNPSGAPQNGDILGFGELFEANGAVKAMVNDMNNLSCTLLFSAVDGDYSLSGNTLKVSEVDVGIADGYVSGNTRTLTINCPLVFTNGGTIEVGRYSASETGENKSLLYLNGSITVQSGSLLMVAAANSGYSGHIYVTGALSGGGAVRAGTEENSGTQASIEFDSASDSSSFTGTLWLYTRGDTQITFNQSLGRMVSSFVGVNGSDTANLKLNQADQSGTTFDIESGGQLTLSGDNAAFDSIVMRNYSGDTNSSVLDTGSTVLTLDTGIAVGCDNNSVTPTIKGQLNLNGDLTMDVHGAATVGLDIPATIEGGGFNKVGTSTLILSGTNTFMDVAEVSQGILDVRNSSALGAVPGNPVTLSGG